VSQPQYPHVLQAVLERPWAILPTYLRAIVEVLEVRISGERFTDEELAARIAEPHWAGERHMVAERSSSTNGGAGAIVVLPLLGVITQRANMFLAMSGAGTSLERYSRAFQQAVDDPRVSGIVMDIDSPGGEVFGVPEFGDQVRAARGKKPIVAVANSLAASAAYWLGTQAGELVVTPSSQVGSIGVWAAHTEFSRADDAAGVTTTVIRSGKFKYEANEFEPLSEDARAHIQEMCDDYYGMFLAAVAKGRAVGVATVRNAFGQGRVVGAREAVRLGMADRVGTLQETVDRVARGDVSARKPSALDDIGANVFAVDIDVRVAAGPIPPHKSPAIADEDAEWDAGAEVAKAEGREQLRRMHAWVDDDGDPDAKGSYKLPHHRADGTMVPKGVFAAAQRLDSTEMPDGDRPGVRVHLDGHYGEMDRTPPWEEEESTSASAGVAVEIEVRRRRMRMHG
jgi:signal peptide peptidase SppA